MAVPKAVVVASDLCPKWHYNDDLMAIAKKMYTDPRLEKTYDPTGKYNGIHTAFKHAGIVTSSEHGQLVIKTKKVRLTHDLLCMLDTFTQNCVNPEESYIIFRIIDTNQYVKYYRHENRFVKAEGELTFFAPEDAI